jgi:PAS domain S-box-containing protein
MAGKPDNEKLEQRFQALAAAAAKHLPLDKAVEKLFNLSLDMLCVADLDGYFRIVNSAFEKTLGHSTEVLLKTPFIEFVHPDDKAATLAAMQQLASGEAVIYFENRYRCKNGSYKWLAWNAVPVIEEGFEYAVARDITDKKRADEQRQRHRQEMAHVIRVSSMGEMASGMAHELNQPLAAIVSYCGTATSLLTSLPEPPQQLCDILERASEQAHRASEIIRRLREFVGKQSDDKQSTDLDQVIEDLDAILGSELKSANVKLEYHLDSQSRKVMANKVQIEQVLVNLIRNSVEAIQSVQKNNGKVILKTRLLPNNSIEITVIDNGPGIEAGMIGKMFNPFQTSKASGMGMGLSVSRSIIEAHGGRIWADEQRHNGAIFGFSLSVCE